MTLSSFDAVQAAADPLQLGWKRCAAFAGAPGREVHSSGLDCVTWSKESGLVAVVTDSLILVERFGSFFVSFCEIWVNIAVNGPVPIYPKSVGIFLGTNFEAVTFAEVRLNCGKHSSQRTNSKQGSPAFGKNGGKIPQRSTTSVIEILDVEDFFRYREASGRMVCKLHADEHCWSKCSSGCSTSRCSAIY